MKCDFFWCFLFIEDLHNSKLDSAHLFPHIFTIPYLKAQLPSDAWQKPDLSEVDGGNDAMVSPTSAASWGWEVQDTWEFQEFNVQVV